MLKKFLKKSLVQYSWTSRKILLNEPLETYLKKIPGGISVKFSCETSPFGGIPTKIYIEILKKIPKQINGEMPGDESAMV